MAEAEKLIGGQIGRYQIEKCISRGSRSAVYLAHDTVQDCPVALRVLFGIFAPDSDLVREFRWARKVAAQLDHAHIGQILAIGLTPTNQLYLVIEYFAAGSLAERIATLKEEGMGASPVDALKLVRQIAEALRAALRAGIIHEHLHPGHIMLRADGAPVLFGLDTPMLPGPPAPPGAAQETTEYLSPEQIEGKILDARSNIYTLGVILYELLSGRRPSGISPGSRGEQQPAALARLEEIRPGLAGQTCNLVHTCLQAQSGARFQTMEEMIQAIDKALWAETSASKGLAEMTWPDLSPLSRYSLLESYGEGELFRPRHLLAASALLLLTLCATTLLLLSRLSGTLAQEAAVPDEPGNGVINPPTAVVQPGITNTPLPTPTLVPSILAATQAAPGELPLLIIPLSGTPVRTGSLAHESGKPDAGALIGTIVFSLQNEAKAPESDNHLRESGPLYIPLVTR